MRKSAESKKQLSSSSDLSPERDFEDVDFDFFVEALEGQAFVPRKEQEILLEKEGQAEFLQKAESYYSHRQLIDFLLAKGAVPQQPVESTVGIGFLDIVNYSYLSKWLSPQENQLILNGLYSAFAHVIKKNGGFLNKVEGDSLMFHFGGNIDPQTESKSPNELNRYLAGNLFHTCVEVQRTCQLFNEASKDFLDQGCDEKTRESIEGAFSIISNLRMNLAMASGVNARFQIQIRVGASIGTVCMGNFGPHGKKQWDVIGEPVIEGRRMEMSAPVGGLRISEKLYKLLDKNGVVQKYYEDFRSRALEVGGKYCVIRQDELFAFREVVIKNKKGARFKSYSVQVLSDLPENIAHKIISFLELGEEGADEILELLQYFRGNRLVVEAVEEALEEKGIFLNKEELLKIISPRKYDQPSLYNKALTAKISLFKIFSLLGAYQDRIDKDLKTSAARHSAGSGEGNYLARKREEIMADYKYYEKRYRFKVYFDRVTFPLVFRSIKSDILAFQSLSMDRA
ncbi:MAG: adenylate/guanylate cyclase domain-containing protein [Spirochaetales bacterium]|nr:adenylate/guanylate cyclase domain-containing protein [Spirochaetales bacterium]